MCKPKYPKKGYWELYKDKVIPLKSGNRRECVISRFFQVRNNFYFCLVLAPMALEKSIKSYPLC